MQIKYKSLFKCSSLDTCFFLMQLPSISATFQTIDDIFDSSNLSPINLLALLSILEGLSLEDVTNSSNVSVYCIHSYMYGHFCFNVHFS